MRHSERKITDFDEIVFLLESCQTIRLGMLDENYPYIVPLSFGFEICDGRLALYFHCAKEGKKVKLLAQNDAVCVEADIMNGYVKTERSVTADYVSVIGFGHAKQVFDDEATHGLELLLKHCGFDGSVQNCALNSVVAVYKIELDSITGKRRFK